MSTAGLAQAQQSPDRAYVNKVLDGLVESGVLTAEQAERIKRQALEAAQSAAEQAAAEKAGQPQPKPKWYDTMKVSGYVQFRGLYYPDAGSGEADTTFQVRRARTKFTFRPTDRTEVEVQGDWGESDVKIRDAWIQRELREGLRLRLGLMDVPFGIETPQSSSRRLPLERNWVTRRFVPDEQDTGVVLFYTRPEDHKAFSYGKKHEFAAGDFGNLALGFFNGQGRAAGEDLDDSKHVLVRLAKPFLWTRHGRTHYAEIGASYYGGNYYSAALGQDVDDYLFNVFAYYAPEPLGLQAEYYNGETEGADLDGWYVMGLARTSRRGVFFTRYDDYNGRRKGHGTDPYDRHRVALGYAHQIDEHNRLTVEYDIQHLDAKDQEDDLLGVQWMTTY